MSDLTGLSGKTVGTLFNSFRGDYKLNSDASCLSLRHVSRHTSSVCHASPGNYQRNSDSFNRKRQGFSRNRNRHNEDRNGFEDLEESETVSSKNGRPLLSVSANQKFQATATPGPREKEIVELFRKVQAQLRERAAMKEEKKVEDLQGKSKQNETVDSLLKLLRKHSVQHGKKITNGAREGTVLDEMTEDETSDIYGGEFLAAEASNLSAMKLTELKALAKSHGIKGFSKLKKIELIELLSDSSI